MQNCKKSPKDQTRGLEEIWRNWIKRKSMKIPKRGRKQEKFKIKLKEF